MEATPTILVVDDHAETVELLRLFLDMHGYEVRTALSAREALQTLHECIPDLIVTDHSMPDMTGLTLGRMLRNDPATSRIPIILFTAWEGFRKETTPFDCVIGKPADPVEVLAEIQTLLRSRPGSLTVRRPRREPALSLR